MSIASQRNIGAFIGVVTSVAPQAATAETINGTAIDRFAHNMPLSCVLHQVTGAETGAPTTASVQTKLQHSADDSAWSDYVQPGDSAVAETSALTAANKENSFAIDLSSASRFIRAVSIVAFTGGTSPTIEVAADIVLGGEAVNPAV